MSQERWDVVLRFLSGALAWQEDLVLRGPVIRIGANPGPGGLKLDGYRGLDDRQAVITAYDGGTVSIAPVGPNQVRVAPHENVSWQEIQPIRGPVFLSDGCAIHLGPPGRGATAVFVEARRLGVWEQRAILSDAAQAESEPDARSRVDTLDIARRIPWWFLPGVLFMVTGTLAMLGLVFVLKMQREVTRLGPVDVGPEKYDYGDIFAETEVNTTLYAGLDQAFHAFLMRDNAKAAGLTSIPENQWDRTLMSFVARAQAMNIRNYTFWRRLESSKDTYNMVLEALRAKGLPDVLAGIPMQESAYNDQAWDTLLCAGGLWQFQPETAIRYALTVRDCRFKDNDRLWTPDRPVTPRNALENAEYVANQRCRIDKCAVDERMDAYAATRAAVASFEEPWNDETLRASGALVQLVIASHNAGYDDSRFDKKSPTNILPAYRAHLKANRQDRAPDFIGRNIACTRKEEMAITVENFNQTCGSRLPNVTQTYVPYVIAHHLLAVCYYGLNYSDRYPAFEKYATYVTGSGYCAGIDVPEPGELARAGSRK